MARKINEECGVFGIYAQQTCDVATLTYYGLYALQHRGQESCGIVVNDQGVFSQHKDTGLVPDVFSIDQLEKLGMGNIAIGHVRYATSADKNRQNAQPLVVRHVKGPMAIALNGVLLNAAELREEYELGGAIFHTSNATEVIAYTITQQRLKHPSIEKAVEEAMKRFKGSYSFVVMSPTKLIAARDPYGMHPLCMGKCADGSIVFASESVALDSIGAELIRDIDPGEIVVADSDGVRSIRTHCGKRCSMCVFEYVYTARPDSVIEGVSVHKARQRAGAFLWKEHPVEADVVIGVPDSGLDAALGLANASGIPYGVGFIKNRYVGRTFILPTQKQRVNAVRIKLNAVKDTVKGKRVILVDDSIVRGTTSARIVNLIREAGATEVHVRISSPPFTNPCYFGTDIDSKDKLIACRMSHDEICKEIGADTLGYLSFDGIRQIAANDHCDFCIGCFTGEYPMEIPASMPKDKFDTKIGAKTNE